MWTKCVRLLGYLNTIILYYFGFICLDVCKRHETDKTENVNLIKYYGWSKSVAQYKNLGSAVGSINN